MSNNFTAYELMVMVDALEKYASACEKRMKDADMDMEREYYKRRMESANRAYKKALKDIFDFDRKFISKSSFISLLEYLKEASKKTDPKEAYTLMAKERFEADIDYFIDLVKNYPSPDYTLPAFFKEDSK